MDINQFELDSKQYMDNKRFKNVLNYVLENSKPKKATNKLLNLVLKYLQNYPQQISLISKKCFIGLVSIGTETLHPLVLFVALQHHSIEYCSELENLTFRKWISLVSIFYQKNHELMFEPVFVANAKERIVAYMDVFDIMLSSPPWFIENIDFFIGLHLIEFDENECEKLFTKLKDNWSTCEFSLNITREAVSFIDLVAAKCKKEIEFTHILITGLFTSPPSIKSVCIADQVINNLKMFEANSCPIKINNWESVIQQSIRYGLTDVVSDCIYIRVCRKLIKKAVVDKSVISKTFEFLVGHSQFNSIMQRRSDFDKQKEEVLRMIKTLVKKEPSIMALSHVPFYLCSYDATLSATDQLLLKILFLYEENSVPMSNYRPYLWGSFAVSHYQVTNHLISKTLNSFPSTTEILSYIPSKRLRATISNFPVKRGLHVKNQKITSPVKISTGVENVFDPAFFLPMISSLLATEAPLSIEKFTKKGCLSMVLVCLGSSDIAMRRAAYHVLTLLRSHLFCRRAENMFWDYFLSWVARGIQDLHFESTPRLPMIQAMFLSRMVLSIANHEKGIEGICCKILLAYPAPRLNHIPELKSLLTTLNEIQSGDKSLLIHWCFTIIRDGLHSKNDWLVIKNMDLLSIILVIFNYCNEKERVLILDIMAKIFEIEPATNGGTGPWALSLMSVVCNDYKRLTVKENLALIHCLKSLSNSSFITVHLVDFVVYTLFEHEHQDDKTIIYQNGFVILAKIVSEHHDAYKYITKTNLTQILNCGEDSKVLSEDEVIKCRSVLEHGTRGFHTEESSPFIFLPTILKILKTNIE